MSDSVFVGIDVSSQTLEVAVNGKTATWQAANDVSGIEQLVSRLAESKPALVVLEATGGYEFEAACALQAAGLALAVVNPRMARDFARACPRAAPASRTRALRPAADRRRTAVPAGPGAALAPVCADDHP